MINLLGAVVDKVNVWGWPWHGTVDADGLHLPNGQVRAHALPARPWNTYRLFVPGTPAVVRTPEQLAADASAGRDWRNEAILCGGTFQLYSKDLSGWIYCAADGSRWIVRRDLGEVRRFGVFGAPADTRTLTINNPSDDGQSTPVVDLGSGPVTALQWADPIDISADGSKAIFMLYTNNPGYAPGSRFIPLGFLLAQIQGSLTEAFVMDVTVLRTRAQTLGTLGYDDSMVIAPASMSFNGNTVNYETATGTVTRTLTGRIWAMWFDAASLPVECTVEVTNAFQQEFPAYTVTGTSPNQFAERFCLQVDQYTYRLKLGAAVHAEATLARTVSGNMTSGTTDVADVVSSLNGVTYRTSQIVEVNSDPMQIDPKPLPWEEASDDQVLPRFESIVSGSAMDLLPYGNNLIGIYARLDMDGPDRHRYLNAASPGGQVLIDETVDLTQGSVPVRNQLYGPLPYGAWNPVTFESAAPVAQPVGWI
jgi:hypothetical protein